MPRSSNWNAFWRDNRGSTAMSFAFGLLPALFLLSAGVDYNNAITVKEKLRQAADAAALAAVNTPVLGKTKDEAAALALSSFNTAVALLPSLSNITVRANVTEDNTQRSATVSYSADVKTLMASIMGKSFITVASTSIATNKRTIYMDFYLVLDNTPSMGIGATQADISALMARTPDNCGFACHIPGMSDDYYAIAKQYGIKMRIDVVRMAAQALMDKVKATRRQTDQFRMASYSFGAAAENPGLTQLNSLTTDTDKAKTGLNALDLMTIPYNGYRQDTTTDFYSIFSSLNKTVSTAGDGLTSQTPQKIVFLVSDGLADRIEGSNACSTIYEYSFYDDVTRKNQSRCMEPLNPAMCDALKNRGVKIAILYTTYTPLDHWFYQGWIAPFQPQISGKMQACATPGFFFEVSPTQGIQDAMLALFSQVVGSAQLTR